MCTKLLITVKSTVEFLNFLYTFKDKDMSDYEEELLEELMLEDDEVDDAFEL